VWLCLLDGQRHGRMQVREERGPENRRVPSEYTPHPPLHTPTSPWTRQDGWLLPTILADATLSHTLLDREDDEVRACSSLPLLSFAFTLTKYTAILISRPSFPLSLLLPPAVPTRRPLPAGGAHGGLPLPPQAQPSRAHTTGQDPKSGCGGGGSGDRTPNGLGARDCGIASILLL